MSVCCRSQLGENIDRVSRAPDKYYLPAYIGPRGWFGLRLDRGPVNWSEVENIVENSYRLAAPKSLVNALDERPDGALEVPETNVQRRRVESHDA